MEINQQPYDTVCHRLEQMGNEGVVLFAFALLFTQASCPSEIRMPNTSVAEPPMTRSYTNRKVLK